MWPLQGFSLNVEHLYVLNVSQVNSSKQKIEGILTTVASAHDACGLCLIHLDLPTVACRGCHCRLFDPELGLLGLLSL